MLPHRHGPPGFYPVIAAARNAAPMSLRSQPLRPISGTSLARLAKQGHRDEARAMFADIYKDLRRLVLAICAGTTDDGGYLRSDTVVATNGTRS